MKNDKIVKLSENTYKINAFNAWQLISIIAFFLLLMVGYLFIADFSKITPWIAFCILLFFALLYNYAFKDLMINRNKSLVIHSNEFCINNKSFFSNQLIGVVVEKGAIGFAAVITSYRVSLRLRSSKGFKKKYIISVSRSEEALLIAQKLALIFNCVMINELQ